MTVKWWFSTACCAGDWLQAAAQETVQEERAKVLKTDPVTPPKVLHAFCLGSRLDDHSSPQGCACAELWGNNVGSRVFWGVGAGFLCLYVVQLTAQFVSLDVSEVVYCAIGVTVLNLNMSLPQCCLKGANKSENLCRPFPFCISIWMDFRHNAQYPK